MLRLGLYALAGSLVISLTLPAIALGACPESSASLGGYGTGTTLAAVFDSSASPYDGQGGTYHVAFDLHAGTLQMQQCCNLGLTIIDAADAFDVVGPPAGTPVALVVRMLVDDAVISMGCGGSGCGGLVGASLAHGADVQRAEHSVGLFSGRLDFHDVIDLPVTIVAGQPERIDFTIYGRRTPGGNHASEGTASYQLLGLPEGAVVTSCQGYTPGPTAARRASWGRLKAAYR